MSGGHFDYAQFHLGQIAESIKDVIDKNGKPKSHHERWDYDNDGKLYPDCVNYYDFSDETVERFKEAYDILKKAYVYAQRIDWLLSGDDGEDTFHERLEKDLAELEMFQNGKATVEEKNYKICPQCGRKMYPEEGVVYTSIPPRYQYYCPKCGYREFDTFVFDKPDEDDDY